MAKSRIDVLYVEDDASDAEFVRTALKESGDDCRITLRIVEDGEEALKYLKKVEPHEGAMTPDLVLLDLNLPKVSGKQVLKEMKASPNLRRTPVVIFSTSEVQVDVDETFEAGACGYITKPSGFDRYRDVVKMLTDYWSKASSVPSRSNA